MNTFNSERSRKARAADTRVAVLAAARAEFEAVGFEAANLRAIARRAGVSAGTVLHHSGDKRELLYAALFEELELTLRKALASVGEGPLEAQLDRLTRAALRYYAKRPALSRTLLKESLFADPPWAEKFAGQAAQVSRAVAGLAVAAQTRGELGAQVDPAVFSAAWLSFYYFALLAWAQGAVTNPARLVSTLTTQHLSGLRPPPRSKP